MNNYEMIGVGTYKLNNYIDNSIEIYSCSNIIHESIKIGYRMIDTAQMYNNQKDISMGISMSGINRESLFLISKIQNKDIKKCNIAQAVDTIMKELNTNYMDLILLHYPVKNYDKSWKELCYTQQHYDIRYIGVSNFEIEHLETIINQTNIYPSLNQIQLNLFNQCHQLVQYHNKHNIMTQSHTTLTKGNLLYNDIVNKLSNEYNVDNDIFMYKYVLDQNIGILPRTNKLEHLMKNYLLHNQLSTKIFNKNDYISIF